MARVFGRQALGAPATTLGWVDRLRAAVTSAEKAPGALHCHARTCSWQAGGLRCPCSLEVACNQVQGLAGMHTRQMVACVYRQCCGCLVVAAALPYQAASTSSTSALPLTCALAARCESTPSMSSPQSPRMCGAVAGGRSCWACWPSLAPKLAPHSRSFAQRAGRLCGSTVPSSPRRTAAGADGLEHACCLAADVSHRHAEGADANAGNMCCRCWTRVKLSQPAHKGG